MIVPGGGLSLSGNRWVACTPGFFLHVRVFEHLVHLGPVAFLVITGARVGAVSSLRLKHINLVDGFAFQDGRDVRTKGGKTITTWFFPMHPDYLACFTNWVAYLRNDKMFGQEDALFPRPERRMADGKFVFNTVSREIYAKHRLVAPL
jgi:integrase